MGHYYILALLVFALNLLPAFAPPTMAVLIFYKLNTDLDTAAIIAIGVLAASSGRYILALGTRALRSKLKREYRENLEHLGEVVNRNSKSIILYFLFFLISPLPSAQVFEAAALMNARLVPITITFLIGRSISYSLYVAGAATLKEHAMSNVLLDSMKSPWGITIQLIALGCLYLLLKVDWSKRLPR